MLVAPSSRPPARHDRLILVQLQGCAQLALAPQRESPGKLVTLGDRRKDARRPGGELILQVAVLVGGDRKSTRLNSSHTVISYAVFCLKKKKNKKQLKT